MISWIGSILSIVLVDLVLSGDNAVVIGATASALPHQQRTVALIIGGGGAIVSRIVLALAATLLLQLPFIGIIGSCILLFIAIHLLVERSSERRSNGNKLSPPAVEPSSNKKKPQTESPSSQTDQPVQKKSVHRSLLVSIVMILLADVTMSLDNVLAIGGLAAGNVLSLVFGLVLSMILLLIGSALVAACISRLPWLLDLACLMIAWTAAQIFLGDDLLNSFFVSFPWISYAAPTIALIIVLIVDIHLYMQDRRYTIIDP